MKYLSRYPLESIALAMVLYFIAIVILIEPVEFSVKISYLGLSLVILFLIAITSFAFRKSIDQMKDKLFYSFSSGKFDKSSKTTKFLILLYISLVLILVISIFEFILSVLMTKAGAITFGFPLPVYSFSADRFLPINFLIDMSLLFVISLFVGKEIYKQV